MSKSPKKHLYSIDLLRGLTALAIGVYHFIFFNDSSGKLFEDDSWIKWLASNLHLSVFVFFGISGFVIAMSMHRNHFRLKKFGAYIARRWVRIEIPYIASIGLYLLIALAWAIKQQTAWDFDPVRFLHHLLYTVPFTDHHWYNEIYWTLAIEFQFYLTIALLFPLFISQNLWVRYGALLVFALSAFIVPDLRFVFRYAPMFVVGILMYLHFFSGENKQWFTLPIIAALLVQIGFTFDWASAVFICLSLLVMPFSVSPKNIFSRFGRMGYSFYLIHGAAGGSVIYFLSKSASDDVQKLGVVLAGVVVSLLSAFIFYKLIEAPSIRWSKRVDFRAKKDGNSLVNPSE